MTPRGILATTALAVLTVVTTVAAAQPAPVGLVSDVEGAVRATRGKDSAALRLLADILAETRLEVAAGARVVILMLASGEEATVRGPATVTVAAAGVSSAPPSALTRRTSGVTNVKLRRKDLAQAAIVMRTTDETVRLPLLSLAGTVTLEPRPVFRWAPVDGSGPYRFTLREPTGAVIHSTVTDSTEVALPATVALVPERAYSWEVSTRRANGLEYSNAGDFSVAGESLRAQAGKMRPAPGADFPARVAYAVWLDSVELSDAAREQWRQLARERPEDEMLRRMAEP